MISPYVTSVTNLSAVWCVGMNVLILLFMSAVCQVMLLCCSSVVTLCILYTVKFGIHVSMCRQRMFVAVLAGSSSTRRSSGSTLSETRWWSTRGRCRFVSSTSSHSTSSSTSTLTPSGYSSVKSSLNLVRHL